MRRVVQGTVLGLLLVGAVGTYAAAAWRRAHLLTPDQLAELPERLARVPLRIDDPPLEGTPEVLEERVVALSGADHYASVTYRGPDGGRIHLHVGAAARSDAWFHEPTACLPVFGWQTLETRLVPLWAGLPGAAAGDRVWRMELEKTGQRMVVYYWLQFGPRIVASRSERRWLRFQDLLAGVRDQPGLIVILYAPVERDLATSEARTEGLVRALWPTLENIFTPGDA